MKRKQILKNLIEKYPEGSKTKNKYKIMTLMAKEMFTELEAIPNNKLSDILYEVINADRDWRKLTENGEKEEKKILSQQWQLNNGYEVRTNEKLLQEKLL